jgi:hypothetical protein
MCLPEFQCHLDGFFSLLKQNNNFDLTSCWQPQVKLLGRGLAFECNFDDNGIQLKYLQPCSKCDFATIFLTHKFSYLLLSNPPIRLKVGLQKGIDYLLITNHLDQSLCLANKKQGVVVRSYSLHSSLASVGLFFVGWFFQIGECPK